LPLDVASIDPDFVVFPTYKWLLGPYGRAFLYVAKRHQRGGVPLEQTASGRLAVNAERIPYFADLSYRPDARRFDMGERDYLITLEMASIGMEMMADWGSEAVSARLRSLTDRAAEALGDCPGIEIPKSRAPNILSIAFQDGVDGSLVETLASRGVHVAKRLGRVRISPHIYNDEADIDRFVSALVSLVTSRG
jgi:selenocysteine lyase/cysteine desulfurase